jgi:hypothetical protein
MERCGDLPRRDAGGGRPAARWPLVAGRMAFAGAAGLALAALAAGPRGAWMSRFALSAALVAGVALTPPPRYDSALGSPARSHLLSGLRAPNEPVLCRPTPAAVLPR